MESAYELDDEDYMSPAERREAIALFKRGKWRGGSLRDLRSIALKEREGLTPTRLERRIVERPIVTMPELAGMAAIVLVAFFGGRYVARKLKARKPQRTTDVRGLDVVIGSFR